MTTSRATSSRHHPTYVRGKSAGIMIALKSSPMASCIRSASGAHRRDDRRDRSQHRTHRNRADSGLRDRPGDDARALGCLQHMSRPPSGFCAASTTPRCRSRVESLGIFAGSFEDMSMTSPTWRALGQVVLVYFAVGGAAVTAQDTQPGRATFAEMIAFARLASVPCQRLAPDADSFHALALRRLIQPPITEEEIVAKEKNIKRLRVRLGLSRWCKRYAGQMEQARILVRVLRTQN